MLEIAVLARKDVSISSGFCVKSNYFECLRPHSTVLLFFHREVHFWHEIIGCAICFAAAL